MTKVVIIGGGAMGEAIATGLVCAGWDDIHVVEANPARRDELATIEALHVTGHLAATIPGARVVVLLVKPKDVVAACEQVAPLLPDGAVVLSMAAGVKLASLATHLPEAASVVRIMPNTPARIGYGMAALSPNEHVDDAQLALARSITDAVGASVVVPENLQDAVTAVSGSGPAYLFYVAEAMIEAGVQLGLPRDVADTLTRQTLLGSAHLLARGEHPSILRERVTSPGGTTAAALAELDAHAVRAGVAAAMHAARDVSAGSSGVSPA